MLADIILLDSWENTFLKNSYVHKLFFLAFCKPQKETFLFLWPAPYQYLSAYSLYLTHWYWESMLLIVNIFNLIPNFSLTLFNSSRSLEIVNFTKMSQTEVSFKGERPLHYNW